MDKPILTPEEIQILESAFGGGLLSMLFQGKITWWRVLLIFSSGLIVAFYFAKPLSGWTGWNEGVVGWFLGFSAMYLCGALMSALNTFQTAPMRFLRAIPLFRTFLGGGESKDAKDDV